MRTPFFSLLFATLLTGSLSAQPEFAPETGRLGITFTPRISLSGQDKLKDNTTTYDDIRTVTGELGITQTFRLEQGRSFRVGIEAHETSIDQDHEPGTPALPLPEKLKGLSATLGYTHFLNRQWILSGRIGAGSYVAEKGLLSEGWALNAMAMAIYNHSQTLTYVFGLAYNSNQENLRILPVFGLNWRPAPKWSVALGLPKTAVTYHFSKALSLGLALSGNGGAYHVKDDPLPGATPRGLADSKLQQREFRLGAELTWKPGQHHRLSVSAGQVLYRKFKYIDRDYELKSHGLSPFLAATAALAF